MNEISKKDKINFLKSLISTQLGIAADCDIDNEKDFWNHMEQDYLSSRAILEDYSPEEVEKYNVDFLTAVNKWIDETNEMVNSLDQ